MQETEEALSDDEAGQEIDEVVPPPGIKDAQQVIKLLSCFYEPQITDTTIFKFIRHIQNDIKQKLFCLKNKQKTILHFLFLNMPS